MEKLKLINQSIAGRWLIWLLTLLFVPIGARGDSYGLTVGGVAVTTDNATNITGDNISGTISFDAGTSTLTLNNAQVNGVISSSITSLNIHLVGSSVFTVDNTNANAYFLTYTGEEQGATVTVSTEAIGASLKAISTSSDNYLYDTNSYTINASEGNWNYWENSTGIDENSLWYVKISKPYVWVAGDYIDDSNLNDLISGGDYSFNLNTNTVTISGLQPEYANYDPSKAREYLVESNLADLNVVVSGTNALFMKSGNPSNITSRVFKYTGASGESSSLNLTMQDGATIEARWDTGVSASLDYLVEGFTEHNISVDLEEMETSGPLAEVDGTKMTIANMTFYDLWILGTQVNTKNAAQIVGDDDGYVSFDGNHTVTLNNYFSQDDEGFNGPFISNGLGDLTINLVGDNTIRGYSSFIAKSTDGGDDYTATFTTTANNSGNLEIYSDVATGHTVEYTGGLRLSTGEDSDYGGEYYIIGLTDYQLTVGDVAVTSANASSITGETIEGTVSYDIDNHMLTLNGATIDGMITTSLPALIVTLAGDNSLMAIAGENGTLEFTGTGTLSLNHSDGVINGFSSVDFGSFNLQSSQPGGVHWDEENSSLRSFDDDAVGNLTLTTTVLYPIWVNDGGEYYQQVTATNKTNVLGDDYSSVSYNGSGTLTVKGAQISRMDYPSIVVGEDIAALTVHLVGYNEIGGSETNAFKFLGESTTLAFTTSETLPGCLVMFGNLSEGQSGTINYQNGLALAENKISVSVADNIDVSHITGYASVINDQDGAVFFYSDGSINWMSNAELSHERPVYVKVLSEGDATATAGIWPSSLSNPSLLQKVTFQFDWGTCANKNVTVQVRGFKQVYNEETYETTWESDGKTYSEAKSLSSANADGIIELPLTSEVTSETIQLYFSSSQEFSFVPLTVALKSAQAYDLVVAGVTVSELNADDVLGDGTIIFDNDENTLTLNSANIEVVEEMPAIDYSGTDNLTISLIGTNTIENDGGCEAIRYNGYGTTNPKLIFAKGDTQPCSLLLETEEGTVISTGFSQIDGINGINNATGKALSILAGGAVSYEYQFAGLNYPDIEDGAPVTSALITSEPTTISFGSNTWATYCSSLNLSVPTGTKAYRIETVGESSVSVVEIGYLPAGKGVLLERQSGASSTVTINSLYTGSQTVTTTGLLGTTAETAVSGISGTVYVLYNDEFVKTTSGSVPANRGYLTISDAVMPTGSRLAIKIGDETVRITAPTIADSDAEQWYDLQGRRIQRPQSAGIYIKNGKKIIIK